MTLQELQKENRQLRQLNQSYKEEHEGFKEKISSLELQLAQLYKLINGFKSERFSPEVLEHQLSLFASDEGTTEKEAPSQETITYTREKQKHPGRN